MKRVQQPAQGVLWFTAVLASRVHMGLVIGLVIWAVLPMVIQWKPTVVMSGSMEPGIQVGDVLVAQPLTQDQVISNEYIGVGSVTLAQDPAQPEKLVTHRVTKILPESNEYITRGDANPQDDSTPVPAESILGLERLRIPYIGIPVQALKTGDLVPALAFFLITVTSQLIIMKDRSLKRKSDVSVGDVEDALKEHSKESNASSKNVAGMALAVATAVGIATVPPASHAAFSGSTFNGVSTITAAASFSMERSIYLNGTAASAFTANNTLVTSPAEFTLEAWFKTTAGGTLIGFSNTASGVGTINDRVLYVGSTGKLTFALNTSSTLQSSLSYNDNNWHHAVLTKASKGWTMYVDGVAVTSDNRNHKDPTTNGYWRVGGVNLSGFPNPPVSSYFTGNLDDVAIYSTVLTPEQVTAHYAARANPAAYASSVISHSPSYYYKLDEVSGPTAFDSSVNKRNATYGTSGVTYRAPRR